MGRWSCLVSSLKVYVDIQRHACNTSAAQLRMPQHFGTLNWRFKCLRYSVPYLPLCAVCAAIHVILFFCICGHTCLCSPASVQIAP